MTRRMTSSQINNMIRQARQKQQQAINNYNRAVSEYNRKAKQAVDAYNRDVREHNRKVQERQQKIKRAINEYNREVYSHNARVRADRQRLKNEIARLNQRATSTHYVTYRVSVNTVSTAYQNLQRAADSGHLDDEYNEILDLSEREAANTVGLMNALDGDAQPSDAPPPDAAESPLTGILTAISDDLADRWRGALFALNPGNPDAARHFCTSAREIIARVLDMRAPDDTVMEEMPECERNQRGTPTRKSKVRYILHINGMLRTELETFIETDIDNIIALFQTFNEGTHGPAGKFSVSQLQAVRRRVE
ncbi:pPIWI-associating nuclease domain-containing protein [Oceanibaculum indicum]|uniref:Predicted pPIWI-associating nuclease domain-containing protein n=1 Tax=Oceanibaculum indicum P24 TaxID=1207063 RepID=K2IWG3_9PROT|nr:hypothetical protein [Oceanibaculum indicum]EKE67198.1 hypothetical protein P24_18779 [Oceanibaculum indicum P24]